MTLQVDIIRDLPIPAYESWTDNQMENWLHPCHGPLPHQLSLLHCLGGDFTVALWAAATSILTFVDLCDEPEGQKSEAAGIVGPIPRTYCWRPRGGSFYSSGREVVPPPFRGSEEAWRTCLCRMIMRESVRLAIEIPVGVQSTWEDLLRPASSLTNKESP